MFLVKLKFSIFFSLFVASAPIFAAAITWNATGSNDDLNTASNWQPQTIPGSSDVAIFDSTVRVNKQPTSTADFSVSDFNFPHSASEFSFSFDNCGLTFNDRGITGNETNTTITSNNINNSATTSGDLMLFNGASNSSGSAILQLKNSGTLSGNVSGSTLNHVNGSMFESGNSFSISDNGQIIVENTGIDHSNGLGGNSVAHLEAHLFKFDNTLFIGNNVNIKGTNSGMFDGTNTSSGNTVAKYGFFDCSFLVNSTVQAGNFFTLKMSNTGSDSSAGVGGNDIGHVTNSLIFLEDSFSGRDNVTISATNSGTYTGSNSVSGNSVGVTGNPLFTINGFFQAGNFLKMTGENSGTDTGSGVGNNNVGIVNDPQLEFNSINVGDNATFSVSNIGTNSNSASGCTTGLISGDQFVVYSTFTSGKNLNLTATNQAINTGGSSQVGVVQADQMNFGGEFIVDDGAVVTASNLGTGNVLGTQINFQQGFSILNGSATFKASNTGTIGGFGIFVGAGPGGNVNIILENSSLNVNTTSPTFTIRELIGDSNSVVQVNTAQVEPLLIIATDALVNAEFSGSIQNYPTMNSALLKTGVGTQKLSGNNTYTGLTTIDAGTLIVSGSIAGDLTINPNATLKGSGQIAGNVINMGKLAPGESIGTITFLSDFLNNNGEYDVEVTTENSDLVAVTGTATLNGGAVVVSSVDGTYSFKKPYTILEAGSVVGAFTGSTPISPFVTTSLTYDPQHVYLTIFTNIVTAGETRNQLAIATQLDAISSPNAQQSLLLSELVSLPANEVRAGLDSLSGYQHTDDLLLTQMITQQFLRRLYDPLRSIVTSEPCCCYNDDIGSIWFDADGSFAEVNGNSDNPGFNSEGFSLMGGIQKTFCQNCTLGVALGYEYDRLHFNKSGGSEKCNMFLAGLYGLYRPSRFYALVDLTYSYSSNDLKRSINVGDLHYEAHSEPKINQYTFYGEIGVDSYFCNLLIQPFFGIEVGSFHRNNAKEGFANGWELDVHKLNRTLTTARLGLHLTPAELLFQCMNVSLDIAWNNLLTSTKNHIEENFSEFGSDFRISGLKLSHNSFDYALTLSSDLNNCCRWYLEGSGEVWEHANIFDILIGFSMNW